MSSMAAQMQQAIDNDGGAGLPGGEQPPAGGAPGNGGGDAAQSAGTSNTDTAAQGGTTPESIPYSRFKEVNDRYQSLKDFEVLQSYGYDPDSLGRLAAFEAEFQRDPIGTWSRLATNLDLPKEVTDALEAHLNGAAPPATETTPPAQGQTGTELAANVATPPGWDRVVSYVDAKMAEDQSNSNMAQLDSTLAAWRTLDEADGIPSPPDRAMLNQISAALSSGLQFQSHADLAKYARDGLMEYRDHVLGAAVRPRTGQGGATLPPSLPGGQSAGGSAPPVRFPDLRAASKAAQAAIESGQLPE